MNHQSGSTLLEALVASAVLALGLSGAAHLGWLSLQMGAESREKALARQLAQDLLDCHATGWPDCPMLQDLNLLGTRYQLQVVRTSHPSLPAERWQVTVDWQGVMPAAKPAAHGDGRQQLQLWRETALVPRWVGVSSR
jgi:type II secretory pathway component PulJ